MEQAMIGPSPNPLILSYLKYAISSQVRGKSTHEELFNRAVCQTALASCEPYHLSLQMVSYSSVLTAISKVICA